MADGVMISPPERIFGQDCSNGLPEGAMHQNQSFPTNTQSLDHQNESPVEYQFHDSRSDCTSTCNSNIFSSNRSRLSYFLSMSSLQSSLESSSQSSPFIPNIPFQSSPPSPCRIIPRERNTEGLYFCPLCIQFKEIIYMKRKGEMKSHIQKHFSNELYYCDNCSTARDRFEDLKTHCKKEHGRCLRSTAMVGKIEYLIRQQLFACGFRDWTGRSYCREVLTDSKDWLDHIAEHMKRGNTPAEWSYSAVIKSLLRQPELCQLWKDYLYKWEGRDKRHWTPLVWDVDRSRNLMLKLNRRDFRPTIDHLLAWAYELGLPTCQPADRSANMFGTMPPLKPPTRDSLQGLSMLEVETVLKRRSSISQAMRALPAGHDSAIMGQLEPALDSVTGNLPDIPLIQLQPESDKESWPNLHLGTSLHGHSGHNPSVFALSQTTLVQYQPQPFRQDPSLPLDADQPPREANGAMGPDSHLLESATHSSADLDYTMFDASADYRNGRPMI